MVTKFEQYSVDDPWLLIIDERVPTPDRDSGSVRMFAIVRLLRAMGFKVAFVDDKNIDDSSYSTALRKQGVEVLHGFQSAAKHLNNSGGRYHFVLLSRPDTVLRYLPIVRANAIQAKVIYDTVDCTGCVWREP